MKLCNRRYIGRLDHISVPISMLTLTMSSEEMIRDPDSLQNIWHPPGSNVRM